MSFREFLYGLLLLAVAFMMSGTTGDPDLWGHVRFGQDMLAHGAIRLPDIYSFTADRAWVNHEWLAELFMAVAFNIAGASGLNVLRIAVIVCVLALVWRAAAVLGDRRRLLVFAACAIGIYMRAHPIRPQLFSLVLFTLLLVVLQRAETRGSFRALVWVPFIMACWVNLHGGWLVGLGYFGLWCAIRAAATSGTRDRITLAAAPVAALGATLLNPYGFQMWEFLATTVRPERPMIADWQPLHLLPPVLWASSLTAFAVLAVTGAHARSRADWIHVALAATLGVFTLRVSRIDAFFALSAVFAAIAVFAARAREDAQMPARRSPIFAVTFVICIAGMAIALAPRIRTVQVPDHLMPDSQVAAYARDEKLTGHVLTWFDWGEYLIWHFGPDLKVSMDGRRETVYSEEVLNAHLRFYAGAPDEWRYADRVRADYVWIPKKLPVVSHLQRHGWRPLCEGEQSVLLARRHDTRQCSPQAAPASRSFPQL